MIGTGPYVLTKFTPGQQAVLTPNKNYWGPKPKNSGLIINYYSKSSTMKLDLQKGDDRHGVPDVHADRDRRDEEGRARSSSTRRHGVVIRYLVFNVKRPPFNNLDVRKAIAYLMPRQDIATRVYHGTVTPLYSMVPQGLPGATTGLQDHVRRLTEPREGEGRDEGLGHEDAAADHDLVDADALR